MKISNGVYNSLVNQAIILKHDSKECGDIIAHKVVDEYFRGGEISPEDKNELISSLALILKD